MKDEKNYITPVGFKRLVDEQDHLVRVERPEVTKVVTWAASLGDRSENADYQYGKKRLREIDKRLLFLKRRIEAAEVVDPTQVKSSKIQFGAKVTLLDIDGQKKFYIIVGVDEINSNQNKISWKSPIGRALIGKEEGDEVVVRTPAGDVEYEILKVEYGEIL